MADPDPSGVSAAVQKSRPCPVCGKPGKAATKPFCSPRCADVDLHRWLGGIYAIPGDAQTGEDDSFAQGRQDPE